MLGDIKYLPKDFSLPPKLSIAPSYVHLIMFIRSNRILDIFIEKFSIPIELEHEYVWVNIDNCQGFLFIYYDFRLIKKLDYIIPKTYIELSKNHP